MPTRISIITPTRNMAHFLEPCILSNLQQCYPNLEHIIVDGASTDNTLEIVGRYPHLRSVSEPDHGLSDALNKGIRMATGEIIGWCNADDLYLPGTLTVINEFFEKHPDIDLVYGDYRETDETGKSLRIIRETHFSPAVFRWLHINTIPTPAAFWRRRIHDDDLWYEDKMRFAMDYDFLRRVFAKGYKFQHVSILFCDFRRHIGSLTAAGGQLREHELIVRRDANAIWKKFGVAFPAIRYCFLVAVRAARTAEKCFKGVYFELARK
ncbi:MAG: glycosyltransferase family 2 protein [Terracidiphilus sp.]|jgi:glycosyltransferase involved in cell wall biosynthesis